MDCHPVSAKEKVTWSRRHSNNIHQPSVNWGSSISGDADRVMKASHGFLSLSLKYWPPPWSKIQIIKRKTWIKILSMSQHAKHAKCDSWMSNNRFWLTTIIKSQRQACYMYFQMDLLYNLLRTDPIQTGREMSMERYLNQQFGLIDNLDRQSGTGSVPTRTRTRSDGPEPLLTLIKGTSVSPTLSVDSTSIRTLLSTSIFPYLCLPPPVGSVHFGIEAFQWGIPVKAMLRGLYEMLGAGWLPHQPSHACADVSTPAFDRGLVIVIPCHIVMSV